MRSFLIPGWLNNIALHLSPVRKIRHNLIPANVINSHEPEPLKLHHLIQFSLNPALPHAGIFTFRRRDFLLSSGQKNHGEHRGHREKRQLSVLSASSVVDYSYADSFTQKKLENIQGFAVLRLRREEVLGKGY